jgi:hypothetical protein
MGAVFTDKTVVPVLVAKKDELFAQDLDSLLGLLLGELPSSSNGMPVTAQQLPAGGAGSYPG